ncbi:hypothetical protein D3C71_1206600 [compost metagenome]
MSYFKVLEFDLHQALVRDLVALLDEMEPANLNHGNASSVVDGQGVYQLFLRDELVYVGKTDLEAGLRRRLLRHCEKIRSRLNLAPDDVSFKAVQIYVFTAMDLEGALIKHYKRVQGKLAWNLSGFGSNDPGKERDNSKLKRTHFDSCYPIDLGLDVNIQSNQKLSVASVLRSLKDQLPYTIRFECVPAKSKKPHPDLINTPIHLESGSLSVRSVLTTVSSALGPNWQITTFPGYITIYREHKNYDHGKII